MASVHGALLKELHCLQDREREGIRELHLACCSFLHASDTKDLLFQCNP